MWKKLDFYGVGGGDSGPTFDFLKFIRDWPNLVGASLGANTLPMRHKNRTLFILTRHPVFSQELSYLTQPLIAKICQRFPTLGKDIDKLAFEANESFFMAQAARLQEKARPTGLHAFDPLYRRLKAEAESMLSHIEDPEEKERWISLYIQMAQTQDPHRA